ncbi:MAG: sodium-translocating pyrophosphatase [Clostridiales bacterium]|nr:sodium-translocating pyrophosphatase [Clostridiales bacterium]
MNLLLIVVGIAVILAVSYAAFNYFSVKKLEEGTERMQEIGSAIRTGANAFIKYEYKIVAIIGAVVAVLVLIIISWQAAIAFIMGATLSAAAGWVGMKIATYCNVRVTNKARESKDLGKTLRVAFKGGTVMGLCVAGFALLGVVLVYLIFGLGAGQINNIIEQNVTKNFIGLENNFTMTLSGYALGCSIIAMFNRVGGGIYTKAADMGADLVGKTEEHIPEDDPRNPATIADNVGDNVGDVAGLGSDLLESYVGAILSAVILAGELFMHNIVTDKAFLQSMMLFPLVFAGCGLLACIIGISYIVLKPKLSKNVHRELNIATWISAGVTVVLGAGLSIWMFLSFADKGIGMGEEIFKGVGFRLGALSPWVAAVLGIIAGIAIGIVSEYYTSYDYKPTRGIAKASKEGSALNITQGLATGMISCMLPVVILAIAIFGSYAVAGMYGVACAAFGMLSFVAATVSVDTYGPISDNAGGIAEMSYLEPEVREITDKLDSVGNTTAAIGKGFAIGSAAFAALSLMTSYLFAFQEIDFIEGLLLNLINPMTLCGALCGAALPYMFSGMLINAVAKAARRMVDEVRRQFNEIEGLREGKVLPDYKTCIEISSSGAIKQMIVPCVVCILFPLVTGFIFGAMFVAGVLIGATISAIMLAIFCGNSGGAWDNAKKYIESGGVEGEKKGGSAHDASVVGDTVGDPLKDTVGPSLDILIKIMSTISLATVVVFSQFNLFESTGLMGQLGLDWNLTTIAQKLIGG